MLKTSSNSGGGLQATASFRHTFFVDFEYQISSGERPKIVCMVCTEMETKQTKRYCRRELLAMDHAPFETGSDAVMVAYAAQAELSCMLALGWKLPVHQIDLYAEFRVETNGRGIKASLLDALALHGLAHIDAAEKEEMRDLILRGGWSQHELELILDYCESDVKALAALYPAMLPKIDLAAALLRGRYAAAVAIMEHNGIWMDKKLLGRVDRAWWKIRPALISEVDPNRELFQGSTFKADQFSRWLRKRDIPWPRLESDHLDLSDDAFKVAAVRWPELRPLRELRQCLDQISLSDLRVGSDGKTRAPLRPWASSSGRNQPSTTRFAFGPAKWVRGFMRPPEGWGLAYIDFSSQEIGLAAGLSGDERLIAAYNDADPYLAFAKQAGMVPADATKASYPVVRDQCKAVVLGQNYGMGADAIAAQAGIAVATARHLIRLHKTTYRGFWRWIEAQVNSALITGRLRSAFGWTRHVTSRDKITSLMNFPMQANGAEMMRVAAIAATEAGIEVCAPIHDAFLITAPLHRLDDDVTLMQSLMTRAAYAVAGLPIKTDAKVIRFPDRYMEDGGIEMWNRVARLIGAPDEQL